MLLILTALRILFCNAWAQAYPVKPIRLIIPFGPGSTDVLGRAYALRAQLGQSVVVENVPGATGVVGLERTAKSAPDGYTIAVAASATFAIAPHTNRDLPYDPIRDFMPIALLSRGPSVVSVNSTNSIKSLDELINYANSILPPAVRAHLVT